MKKILFVGCITALLAGIVSCQHAAPAITSTPTAAQPTNTPTPTSIPTNTPTSTPTPYPTLSPTGPYLLYDTTVWSEGRLTILDTFGGHRSLELPEDNYISNLKKAISPDGKWLAFYIGPHQDHFPTYEKLTLNLLYIPDGSIHFVTDVITNYPNNLPIIAGLLSQEDPKNYPPDTDWTRYIGEYFKYGITALSWSPDGQYLAFSAQIDGPSSDVYIYDMVRKEIHRLTADDSRNVLSIDWPPDGHGVLFTNSIPREDYSGASLHYVKADSEPIKQPKSLISGTWWSKYCWISPYQCLIYFHGDGGDYSSGLFSIDVETSKETILWKEEFLNAFTIDNIHNQIALSGKEGVYLVSFDGTYRKISDEKYIWFIGYLGGTNSRFLGFDDDRNQIAFVGLDGTITPLFNNSRWDNQGGSHNISISPDHLWLVSSDKNHLELYSETGELVFKSSDFPTWAKAIWRPDSKGFYVDVYTTRSMLYYISVPDGKSTLVDECPPSQDECALRTENSVWLP